MQNELIAHPLCACFPEMGDDTFAAFCEDIREHGLLEPITILEGMILDGKARYKACQITDTEPVFRQFEGTEQEAASWVFSQNAMRRQLTVSQQAMVAAHFAINFNISAAKAAETAGVDPTTVERARKVINSGDQNVISLVETGAARVTRAADYVTGRIDQDKFEEQVKRDGKKIHPGGPGRPRGKASLNRFKQALRILDTITHEQADEIAAHWDGGVENYRRVVKAGVLLRRVERLLEAKPDGRAA